MRFRCRSPQKAVVVVAEEEAVVPHAAREAGLLPALLALRPTRRRPALQRTLQRTLPVPLAPRVEPAAEALVEGAAQALVRAPVQPRPGRPATRLRRLPPLVACSARCA